MHRACQSEDINTFPSEVESGDVTFRPDDLISGAVFGFTPNLTYSSVESFGDIAACCLNSTRLSFAHLK